MEITGRLTAGAKTTTLKDDRTVVNFSIAMNDSFKTKGSSEVTKVTTYVNCAYWLNPGIASHLVKGTMVQLYGRIGVNAWTNNEGEAKAGLTFHVNNIKMLGKPVQATTETKKEPATADDLPF